MGLLQEIAKRLAPAAKQAEELGARYVTKAQGPAAYGRVFTAKELADLQDQLAAYARPRMLSPDKSNSLAALLREAENPGMRTHVLYTADDEPAAAFQLTSQHDLPDIGDYMPNLVSLLGQKGVGTQALQEARRPGPYGLVATPSSRDFYEKMGLRLPNFGPLPDEDLRGVAYQYKAMGGAVMPNIVTPASGGLAKMKDRK